MVSNNKGRIISCWSGLGHQNGNTTFTVLSAYTLSEFFPNKNILTMDMNFRFAVLEYIMNNTNSKGIDNLMNAYCTNSITKENFCECLDNVKVNGEESNIYNLSASKNRIFNSTNEFKAAFNEILDIAQGMFDFIIIDNSAGDMDMLTTINQRADVVVNLLKQNKLILDYVKNYNGFKKFNEDKFINVVNEYDEIKGINLDFISKNYNLKNLKKLEFNKELPFYINDGQVSKIFEDKDSEFIKSIDKIILSILKMLEVETPSISFEKQDKGIKKIFSSLGLFAKKEKFKSEERMI